MLGKVLVPVELSRAPASLRWALSVGETRAVAPMLSEMFGKQLFTKGNTLMTSYVQCSSLSHGADFLDSLMILITFVNNYFLTQYSSQT